MINVSKIKKENNRQNNNMQKSKLEKEQLLDKNKLINNLFSIFNFFQNYYDKNELKEIYEYIKK